MLHIPFVNWPLSEGLTERQMMAKNNDKNDTTAFVFFWIQMTDTYQICERKGEK